MKWQYKVLNTYKLERDGEEWTISEVRLCTFHGNSLFHFEIEIKVKLIDDGTGIDAKVDFPDLGDETLNTRMKESTKETVEDLAQFIGRCSKYSLKELEMFL